MVATAVIRITSAVSRPTIRERVLSVIARLSSESRDRDCARAAGEAERQVNDHEHKRSDRESNAAETRLQLRKRGVRARGRKPPDARAQTPILVERENYHDHDQHQLDREQ